MRIFDTLKNITRVLRDRLFAARDPVGFARSLGVRVGENVRFYGVSRSMFGSEPWMIKIGNDCHITAGVQFINHDGGTLILRKHEPTLEWTAPILIGNDVYIGINSIILPNVSIGNSCVIGAGAVVTKDVPDNTVYAGVPARFICTVDDYFNKLKKKSLSCGHLSAMDKAVAIRNIYHDRGWFKE
jgi:acetyltransferase-like isoleucine patch superfamily enzyme